MEAIIIDWLEGRQTQYTSLTEAEGRFKRLLTEREGIECDLTLCKVIEEFNNVD